MGAIRTREVSPRLVGGHPRGQTAPFAGSLGLCRGAGANAELQDRCRCFSTARRLWLSRGILKLVPLLACLNASDEQNSIKKHAQLVIGLRREADIVPTLIHRSCTQIRIDSRPTQQCSEGLP